MGMRGLGERRGAMAAAGGAKGCKVAAAMHTARWHGSQSPCGFCVRRKMTEGDSKGRSGATCQVAGRHYGLWCSGGGAHLTRYTA